MNYQSSQSGFTLIELLVVISIISLLSSVILVGTLNARVKARNTVRKQTMRQLQKALEMYFEDNGQYPIAGYNASEPGDPNFRTTQDWIPGLAPKYIAKLPQDPKGGDSTVCTDPWKQSYQYASTDGLHYKILAHCVDELVYDHSDPFTDPVRDGGSSADPCVVDGPSNGGWAWQVSTPGQCRIGY